MPRYLFSCALFPLFFLCCVCLLIFPTMLFPEAQQDSMEREHQYLAFIFVFQTDLGRSSWSSKSIRPCQHEHLAHPCHGSAPRTSGSPQPLPGATGGSQVLFSTSHCSLAKTGKNKSQETTESWESFNLPCAGCGGDHWHCPGFVRTLGDTTCSFSWQGKAVSSEKPS